VGKGGLDASGSGYRDQCFGLVNTVINFRIP
jgi:hypothetical protein